MTFSVHFPPGVMRWPSASPGFSHKVLVQKKENFSFLVFPLKVLELNHTELALIKHKTEQIRYRKHHCAIKLGSRSEGQVEAICPLLELGGGGE